MSDNESEMDIVKYLGFSNTDELAELLSKSTLETLQPGENLIYTSSHYFEIDCKSKNYVSDIELKFYRKYRIIQITVSCWLAVCSKL